MKRASWKRAFLQLPERCTSDCHPDLAIVILSEAKNLTAGLRDSSLTLRMTGGAQDDK
jgi:hypothetical protein